ncbi:hypothetical protein [Priestia megaterium]|uniref:hypothetical protein n=1 Tax=Priestia megaterium TaxID=1404 RepID=UPI000BF7DC18|nr:hypothetical protein [Priestia megaterium]PFR93541.1 hypothetical protein COK39_17790 [Priestia megaterium]
MLFASKKIQTVGTIREFLNPVKEVASNFNGFKIDEEVSAMTAGLITLSHLLPRIMSPNIALAASTSTKEQVSNQIMNAFDPLTHLVQGLAYPITFLTLTVAGIHWILDNKEKAVSMMQGSAIGFIIVQMSPLLMKLLVQITAGF